MPEANIISINFEDMRYAHLLTAKALHDEIIMRAQNISGKVYLFFDEIQEVADWEKCINSFRVEFDCDIYITGSRRNVFKNICCSAACHTLPTCAMPKNRAANI